MNTQILWYTSRATGAVSLVLFTAVMVLGIATSSRVAFAGLPRAGLLRLHRTITLTAMAFLTVHIVTAIADGYVDLNYWDVIVPFGSGFDPLWIGLAAVAVDLLIAIGITSALRRHLSPKVWRVVHLSAYAMWPLAVLHGFGVSGGDGRQTWMVDPRHRLSGSGDRRRRVPAAAGQAPGHRRPGRRRCGPPAVDARHRCPVNPSRRAPMTSMTRPQSRAARSTSTPSTRHPPAHRPRTDCLLQPAAHDPGRITWPGSDRRPARSARILPGAPIWPALSTWRACSAAAAPDFRPVARSPR